MNNCKKSLNICIYIYSSMNKILVAPWGTPAYQSAAWACRWEEEEEEEGAEEEQRKEKEWQEEKK